MWPPSHDDETVAELFGLVHVMRGQDEGDPASLELVEPLPQQMSGLGVEAGRGFVEQEQVRLVDEGTGNGEAALHAARQRVDLRVTTVG